MTNETLKKGIELSNKIEEYKSFLKAYNAPYINVVKACDFKGDVENNMFLYLAKEPELEIRIREYVMHKIEVLEQEFEKLN